MLFLRQEGCNLYLLMCQRAVPNRKKTRKHLKAPNANRETNESTTWASRRRRRYSLRTGSSSTESNVDTGACTVLRAVDRQLVLGTIQDTAERK